MAGRENLIALAGWERIKTLSSVRNRVVGRDESIATVSKRTRHTEASQSSNRVRIFLIWHVPTTTLVLN